LAGGSLFKLYKSFVVTGGIHCVTGGVRVGFWGLDKRFTAAINGLTGVIGGLGA
jgi:hypothetical protein